MGDAEDETDTVTDCMGVATAEDGSSVACTSDLGVCCDNDGNCGSAH